MAVETHPGPRRRRRRGLLRGPLRALGARQLAGDRDRLHAATGSTGRSGSPTTSAGARCGSTPCSSTARTRSPTTSRPTSTPRRARSRSTSSPPSRPTRPATASSSSASCTRSSARGDGSVAGVLAATRGRADVGPPPGLRAPAPDGRRAARGPLAAQARRGGDALPRRRRGRPGPARPAHDRGLPRALRRPPRLPRGDAARLARRAAPHRLRRQAARGAAPRGARGDHGGDRRRHPRGAAVDGRGAPSRRTGTAATRSASASRSRTSPRPAPPRSSRSCARSA